MQSSSLTGTPRGCRPACIGAANLLPTLGLALAVLLAGCGEDGPARPADGTQSPLTFTRADSSVIQFSPAVEVYVWCGDWIPDEVPIAALHIWVGTRSPGQAYWWLRAVVSDVPLGVRLPFPNYFIWDQPDSVHIFLFDPPNELATDTEESSGAIIFHQLPCPGGDRVDFSIDAVLGSEFGGAPAVAARGRFTQPVTEAPPWGLPGLGTQPAGGRSGSTGP